MKYTQDSTLLCLSLALPLNSSDLLIQEWTCKVWKILKLCFCHSNDNPLTSYPAASCIISKSPSEVCFRLHLCPLSSYKGSGGRFLGHLA